MATHTGKINRALVSVFDKSGLVELGKRLQDSGVEILSTGGTAKALAGAGIAVTQVSDHTGSPEILGGRVKTLHPKIHGGILARRDDEDHMAQLERNQIAPIDLVVVNLYPFEETVAGNADEVASVIEMIDIGGPTMIRSAAKNCTAVAVVTDPDDYSAIAEEIGKSGSISTETRVRLAAKAFAHTAYYDGRIADYMARVATSEEGSLSLNAVQEVEFPDVLSLGLKKIADLRYGENPHQKAALYSDPGETAPGCAPPAGPVSATQLHGKALSFNNILDLDGAWAAVSEMEETACVIVKHTTPAGAAMAATLKDAYVQARDCDSLSAFGGIAAFNRRLDAETAREMKSIFLEAVIAPGFEPEALSILQAKKNVRIMEMAGAPGGSSATRPATGLDIKRITGGILIQERDQVSESSASFKTATRRNPTPEEMSSLLFAWRIARHVKSNAIVYARGTRTAGIGAGQMSRVDAAKIGSMKAQESLKGTVLASDAFFPFRDGIDEAAKAGVTAIIQPGGSVRDDEVIAAADEHGLAMLFTGKRHFRH
jgi:phosphoribosylaminoimidazolecarboxamide formyltransferase/IMP cyclohydrolase